MTGKDYSEKKLLSIRYSFLPLSLAIRKGTYQAFSLKIFRLEIFITLYLLLWLHYTTSLKSCHSHGISSRIIWNFSYIFFLRTTIIRRCLARLGLVSSSISLSIFSPLFSFSLPLFLSPSLSLFSLIFHSLLARRRFRAVHRDDWRIDSSRVVQSGLRHRVCVFQKCWRRLSRRSSSPAPVSTLFLDLFLSLPTASSFSSQNQWVECSLSVEHARITKVHARERSRDCRDHRFSSRHRTLIDLAPLIYPIMFQPFKFGRICQRTT